MLDGLKFVENVCKFFSQYNNFQTDKYCQSVRANTERVKLCICFYISLKLYICFCIFFLQLHGIY